MEPTVPGLIDDPHARRLPASAQAQLGRVLGLFRSSLGSALRDVILHGSAATSGFAPGRSDLDLLALVDEGLSDEPRQRLGAGLLAGQAHRARFTQGDAPPTAGSDEDLAAHLSVARARGIALLGRLDTAALPMVPRRDYLRAIASDFAWAERAGLAAYAHANACRTLAYLRSGEILSKHEGLAWCTDQGVDSAHVLEAALLELQRALDEDGP